MREFYTGATRDDEQDKLDYWGFESAIADEAFAAYMHKHRKQADGQIRDSDNWKMGLPIETYQRSLYRHVKAFKKAIEEDRYVDAVDIAQAIRFNIQGWTHEILKDRPPEEMPWIEDPNNVLGVFGRLSAWETLGHPDYKPGKGDTIKWSFTVNPGAGGVAENPGPTGAAAQTSEKLASVSEVQIPVKSAMSGEIKPLAEWGDWEPDAPVKKEVMEPVAKSEPMRLK